MYDRLREAVEQKGEVMIITDSGEEHELHKHNVEFLGDGMAKINAVERIHWLDLEKVERYYVHKDF